jgi:hypothetical protein
VTARPRRSFGLKANYARLAARGSEFRLKTE